jgi:hypothetical protein
LSPGDWVGSVGDAYGAFGPRLCHFNRKESEHVDPEETKGRLDKGEKNQNWFMNPFVGSRRPLSRLFSGILVPMVRVRTSFSSFQILVSCYVRIYSDPVLGIHDIGAVKRLKRKSGWGRSQIYGRILNSAALPELGTWDFLGSN